MTLNGRLSSAAGHISLMLVMLAVTACGGGGGGGGEVPSGAVVPPIVPVVSISGVIVDEGTSGVTNAILTVTLSSTTSVTASVAYATSDGSAVNGEDYHSTSGILIFTPGSSSGEITVPVIGDVLFEPDESFEVVLSSPQNATLGTARAAVTIRNDDVQTASIRLVPDAVVALVAERITLSATALAADGSVLAHKPVTWSVANPAVASISAAGELTATMVGTTAVIAAIEGRSTQLQLTVTGEPLTALQHLKARFPYVAASGAFRVASDISPDFSQQHLEHLLKTWQFFSGKFSRSPGTYTEMYYTRDRDGLHREVRQVCPAINNPGAGNLAACLNAADSTYAWFVVPGVEPDFGTQLHELGQTFLGVTARNSEILPWFNEGVSMYWESGSFDARGAWTVTRPLDYLTSHFGRLHEGGSLIPLQTLLTLSRDQFEGESDATRPYSQAGMLLYFLFDRYPEVMADLLGAINDQTIKTNAELISFVSQGTHLSIAELEQAYTQFGLDPGAIPTAPSISSDPVSRTVSEGQTASFSVTASGTPTLSYQWQKNGADIAGATGASYTTPPVTFSDNGSNFGVTVTNAYGSATSGAATLSVSSGTPTTGQLLLLDRTFDHTTSYRAALLGETPWAQNANCIFVQALDDGKGARACNHEAFKFFQMPSNNPANWRSPVDYSRGTLYQRVQIISKPSSTPARYGMCMFQDNVWPERHACGDLTKVSFTAPGTFFSTQSMATLYQYNTAIDWTRKPHVIMLHITDANNRQPDSYDGFMGEWVGSPNWNLYYPMRLRYTAIIVPPGGGAPVWPN